MKTTYTFLDIAHPERALLSVGKKRLKFSDSEDVSHFAEIEIILNRISVHIETEKEWNLEDLKNTVKNLILNVVNIFGYLHGLAYEVEVSQVINCEKNVNYVFGVQTAAIAEISGKENQEEKFQKIQNCLVGKEGFYLSRALNDFTEAMKNPMDTAFHCRRAVESLRQIIKHRYPLEKNVKSQWEKLADLIGFSMKDIEELKLEAEAQRHGDHKSMSGNKRIEFMVKTWNILNTFFEKEAVFRSTKTQ
jgi:hypothetical protein